LAQLQALDGLSVLLSFVHKGGHRGLEVLQSIGERVERGRELVIVGHAGCLNMKNA